MVLAFVGDDVYKVTDIAVTQWAWAVTMGFAGCRMLMVDEGHRVLIHDYVPVRYG